MEMARKIKIAKIAAILWVLVVLGGLPAQADPYINGLFETSDGYDTGYYVNLQVEGDTKKGDPPLIPVAEKGQLWTYQQTTTSALYGALIMPRTLVDNSYGDNIVNWPKDHEYHQLKNSDDAIFTIKSGATELFNFTIDYLNKDDANPSTPLFDFEAEVFDVHDFTTLDIVAGDITASTSQVYNMNTYYPDSDPDGGGVVDLMVDSPLTLNPSSYVIDSSQSNLDGWEFDYIYEFCIDESVMAQFSDVGIGVMHISPNKIGKNRVYDDLELIPAPPAVILGVIGLGFTSWLGRRKFSV